MSILLLLRQLDQAYDTKSWHGPNLRGSLSGVNAVQAGRRPVPDRHSIVEIALHAAYWKYAVCRRIAGDTKDSFPLEGHDWFRRPEELEEQQWERDLALLSSTHGRLRSAVETFDESRLFQIPEGSESTFLDLTLGVAAHDLYHAGQIQLIKRLLPAGGSGKAVGEG